MILVAIAFTHYSPKDSESGVKERIIATDIDQAVAYIDKEYMYGYLTDAERDGDENSSYWLEKEGRDWRWLNRILNSLEKAKEMGLQVKDDDGDIIVEGKSFLITKWFGGQNWNSDISDAFYGVTQWNWQDTIEITQEDCDTLIRLGVAKDIRNENILEHSRS